MSKSTFKKIEKTSKIGPWTGQAVQMAVTFGELFYKHQNFSIAHISGKKISSSLNNQVFT